MTGRVVPNQPFTECAPMLSDTLVQWARTARENVQDLRKTVFDRASDEEIVREAIPSHLASELLRRQPSHLRLIEANNGGGWATN